MPGLPTPNFIGGRYNARVLTEDTIFYRGGEASSEIGRWYTATPPESSIKVRIDTTVKPQWIDPHTGILTGHSYVDTCFAVKIPAGTVVYDGPVGYQGGIYLGGENFIQTFIPNTKSAGQVIDFYHLK